MRMRWVWVVAGGLLGCGEAPPVSLHADGSATSSVEGADASEPDAGGEGDDGGFLLAEPPPVGFVRVQPGKFVRGSPETEVGHAIDEDQHSIHVTLPLFWKTTEVTFGEWAALMGTEALFGRNWPCYVDDCPVYWVSWLEAVHYANAQSRSEGLQTCYAFDGCTGIPGRGISLTCESVTFAGIHCAGYRLPTDAEFEYAARAGTVTAYSSGPDEADLAQVGWYAGNSGGESHPVGQKPANGFGLFDMHGNLAEWCHDWTGPFAAADVQDPVFLAPGPSAHARVTRGGHYRDEAEDVRSAARHVAAPEHSRPWIGFRVVRPAGTVRGN